jgi:peptidoglycan hydrolase CwlO-like protein
MQCVGFWSGLVVSLLLGQGWVSILYGFATSGICELTDIVTKKIENMTDYEFQLQNEVSDLRATINQLRAEIKQRDEANEELSAMLQDCQKKLAEALKREKIAKKVIAEKRKKNV